jgi:hypothetical protein
MTIEEEIAAEAKDKHGQECPHCGPSLETICNSYGGGSHYWTLKCTQCKKTYVYDTHRFKLGEIDERLLAIIELTAFFEEKINKIHGTPGKRWTPEEIHKMREERGPLPIFGEDKD